MALTVDTEFGQWRRLPTREMVFEIYTREEHYKSMPLST
jgi:hypothetical protein